jgi:hypothetical protein
MQSMFIYNEHHNFTLTRTEPVTSGIRQRSPFYQIQCRVQIDTLFCNVLCSFFLSFYHLMAAFEIKRLVIFWTINLDHRFEIYNNRVLIVLFLSILCNVIAL